MLPSASLPPWGALAQVATYQLIRPSSLVGVVPVFLRLLRQCTSDRVRPSHAPVPADNPLRLVGIRSSRRLPRTSQQSDLLCEMALTLVPADCVTVDI